MPAASNFLALVVKVVRVNFVSVLGVITTVHATLASQMLAAHVPVRASLVTGAIKVMCVPGH